MKHIYKLSIVLLAVFTFVGCNVDDDAVSVLPQKLITASLANQVDIIGIPDNATSYDLVINFSEELPSYSTIEYSLDGGTTTSSASTGDNTLVISVDFAPTDNFHDVDLSDFIVVNAAARNFKTSLTGNSSVRLVRQGFFSAKMTWEGNQDLDLDLDLDEMTFSWGWSGNTLDSSAAVTNEENVSDMLADGNYALWVFEWPQNTFSSPVDINFDIVTAGGNFSFTINAQDFGWQLWLTKSTDGDGNVSYTFYTEDPS